MCPLNFFPKLEKKCHGTIEMLYAYFRGQIMGGRAKFLIGLPNPKAV
jgi:hypothetical protein